MTTYAFPLYYLSKPYERPPTFGLFADASEFELAAFKAAPATWRWPEELTHDDLREALVHGASAYVLTDDLNRIADVYREPTHPLHFVAGQLLRKRLDFPPDALLDLILEHGAPSARRWVVRAAAAGL